MNVCEKKPAWKKKKNTATKYLNNIKKNVILISFKIDFLELEKDFKVLKDRELRDRKITIYWSTYSNILINISIDEKEITKKRPLEKKNKKCWVRLF